MLVDLACPPQGWPALIGQASCASALCYYPQKRNTFIRRRRCGCRAHRNSRCSLRKTILFLRTISSGQLLPLCPFCFLSIPFLFLWLFSSPRYFSVTWCSHIVPGLQRCLRALDFLSKEMLAPAPLHTLAIPTLAVNSLLKKVAEKA